MQVLPALPKAPTALETASRANAEKAELQSYINAAAAHGSTQAGT